MSFLESKPDPTKKPVPINPPEHSSKELWAIMNKQCSMAAGFGGGPDEKELVIQNNDQHPSEVERMIKTAENPSVPSGSTGTSSGTESAVKKEASR